MCPFSEIQPAQEWLGSIKKLFVCGEAALRCSYLGSVIIIRGKGEGAIPPFGVHENDLGPAFLLDIGECAGYDP